MIITNPYLRPKSQHQIITDTFLRLEHTIWIQQTSLNELEIELKRLKECMIAYLAATDE